MRRDEITAAQVKILLRAKKYIHKELKNNWAQRENVPLVEVLYEIRRCDHLEQDLHLRFYAKLARPAFSGGLRPLPGFSLQWYGQRVRGIDWKLRHDVVKDGGAIGKVRLWHEHQWTDTDEDRFVIDANRFIHNADFWTLLRQCLKRWKIEDSTKQLRLGE